MYAPPPCRRPVAVAAGRLVRRRACRRVPWAASGPAGPRLAVQPRGKVRFSMMFFMTRVEVSFCTPGRVESLVS